MPVSSVARTPRAEHPAAPRGALLLDSPEQLSRAVEPHLARLVGVARRILGSEDLAWDAVQETLLRLWLRGWCPEHPARALAHLVRRSSLHQLRCLRRRGFHEARAGERVEPCCEEDPLQTLQQEELAEELRAVLARLSHEHRSVFELFELEGHSYEAIADRLEIPIGTVRSRLSRARAQVREQLESSGTAA